MSDVLGGIIDHHCQLISPVPIGTSQDKVANLLVHVLRLGAAPAIHERDVAIVNTYAPRFGCFALSQAFAASAAVRSFTLREAAMTA
jgi:hypothetical protein